LLVAALDFSNGFGAIEHVRWAWGCGRLHAHEGVGYRASVPPWQICDGLGSRLA
jgi:hypothetical protein